MIAPTPAQNVSHLSPAEIGVYLLAPAAPESRLLAEVHHSDNKDLIKLGGVAIHNPIGESVQTLTPINLAQALPGVRIFEDSIDSPAEFVEQLIAKAASLALVIIKRPFEICLGFREDGCGH